MARRLLSTGRAGNEKETTILTHAVEQSSDTLRLCSLATLFHLNYQQGRFIKATSVCVLDQLCLPFNNFTQRFYPSLLHVSEPPSLSDSQPADETTSLTGLQKSSDRCTQTTEEHHPRSAPKVHSVAADYKGPAHVDWCEKNGVAAAVKELLGIWCVC